jgi:hypothetical protein
VRRDLAARDARVRPAHGDIGWPLRQCFRRLHLPRASTDDPHPPAVMARPDGAISLNIVLLRIDRSNWAMTLSDGVTMKGRWYYTLRTFHIYAALPSTIPDK